MSDVSLKPIIEKLESLFSVLNEQYYKGELNQPIISVSPNRSRSAYGWCTSWRAWRENIESEASGKPQTGYYEINICAEFLARPFEQIAETMLHEMVHLYNLSIGVVDTGSNGLYHNKLFKKAAEEHGLAVERQKQYGWCLTSLTEASKEFIASLDGVSFRLYRDEPASSRGKQSYRKYVCPKCGTIVRATKAVNIVCGDCSMFLREGD